ASVVEVNHLMNILHTYELASGQEINLAKSEVFFSRSMPHATKEDLSSILGVRHVLGTAFNMAMVAKQAWNIIQNPNSLAAKLIKAGYFPRSSLLEASLGYNPSFAWRSIWKARQILLRGCRWRIGSGDMIRVMYDPWLLGKGDRWVSSPQVEEDR
ncbi:ribonuclease H, partial [Trifolium pratense]